jgi:S1-C subfamily serine protease
MVIDVVEPLSLAERLGIRPMDVLVSLDGRAVRHRGDIAEILSAQDAPATATARVVREGAALDLSAPRERK